MPTVSEIVSIRPIAQYLAQIDIPKKGLYGGGTDIQLPRKIYLIGKSVQRVFDADPTDDTLELTANFLYTLLGIYGLKALIVDQQQGTISPPEPVLSATLFPFYIFSANFESDGKTYLNSKIAGVNLSLFINEGSQQFFLSSDHFTVLPGGGFTITVDWFDANSFDYQVRVERYYPIPT